MGRRAAFDHAAVDYHVEPGTNGMLHSATAHLAGQKLGYLEWDPRNGEVAMVQTHRDARGLGIATGLWQHAHAGAQRHGIIPPKHSDVKLPDGARWANGMTAKSGPRPLGTKRLSRQPGPGQQALL